MSHRIHSDLFRVPKSTHDPGDAGTIRVNEDLQIVELVSAGAETRALDDPTKQGIRLIIRMLTDGGDIVMTAENGLNATGNTQATFADASDLLSLISVKYASGFRWNIVRNVGSVALA